MLDRFGLAPGKSAKALQATDMRMAVQTSQCELFSLEFPAIWDFFVRFWTESYCVPNKLPENSTPFESRAF